MSFASSQQEARQAWISAYPFEVSNGGDGAGIDATTSSSRVALVGSGASLELNNEDGESMAYFKWGDSNVTATTSSYRVGPGLSKLVTISKDELATVTHVACIMAPGSSTTRVMIYRGHGN